MRMKRIVTAAAVVAAASAGFAAHAQTYNEPITPIPGERIYVQPLNQPSGPIHGGYVTDADEQLLSDAIGALSSDRRMDGSIVTMVASNSALIVDGTTVDGAQASRIETKLKQLSGVTRVSALFDSAGA
jgi:hypothetical protein